VESRGCGRVVVTGGAGFIGRHTVRLLSSSGCEVIVLDIAEPPSGPQWPEKKVAYWRVDVGDWDRLWPRLSELRGSIDAVIHLAAVVSVEEARRRPREALRVNVAGTLNMLEAVRLLDTPVFVYASSAAVYGEPREIPVGEEHPREPANLYGDTKAMGEMLVERYSSDYGIRGVSLRYFNVYGPGMRGGPYAGVIHAFITRLLESKPPIIYGDGGQTRDFVYVEDVARANLYAIQSSAAKGPINIGTGRETSINSLYQMVCRLVGYCPPPLYAPPRPGDVRRSAARIEKARSLLGWEPRVSLEEGLRATIEWYRRLRKG
jgi:UDP-glucose 4-epimerase